MKLFGLTGGIASGKSSVAAMLRAAGVPVIDADALAREAVAKGSEGLASIVEAFGEDVLLPDGELDRARVGALVFGDEAKRRTLNAVVHPRVAALAAERAQALAKEGHELAVYEVPLLFENGLDRAMDATVLVAAPEEVQIARMRDRDGLDEPAARARLAAQMPLAEKRRRADHVIDNTGTLEETRAQLEAVWRALTGADLTR